MDDDMNHIADDILFDIAEGRTVDVATTAHLEGCAACQARVAEAGVGAGALQALPPSAVSAHVQARIDSALDAEFAARDARAPARRSPWAARLAVGFSLVAIAGVAGIAVNNSNSDELATSTAEESLVADTDSSTSTSGAANPEAAAGEVAPTAGQPRAADECNTTDPACVSSPEAVAPQYNADDKTTADEQLPPDTPSTPDGGASEYSLTCTSDMALAPSVLDGPFAPIFMLIILFDACESTPVD